MSVPALSKSTYKKIGKGMLERFFKRNWISPLAGVAFASVAVSGILMFFHIRIPGMRYMHELMGVLLAVAGTIHILLNWRPFTRYFRTKAAIFALIGGLILCLALMIAGAKYHSNQGRYRGGHGQAPAAAEQPRTQPGSLPSR